MIVKIFTEIKYVSSADQCYKSIHLKSPQTIKKEIFGKKVIDKVSQILYCQRQSLRENYYESKCIIRF